MSDTCVCATARRVYIYLSSAYLSGTYACWFSNYAKVDPLSANPLTPSKKASFLEPAHHSPALFTYALCTDLLNGKLCAPFPYSCTSPYTHLLNEDGSSRGIHVFIFNLIPQQNDTTRKRDVLLPSPNTHAPWGRALSSTLPSKFNAHRFPPMALSDQLLPHAMQCISFWGFVGHSLLALEK
jgi:hypothetical protein